MNTRIKKLIEICGFEEDTQTWNDITSKLFSGLDIQTLYTWRHNKDRIVLELDSQMKKDKVQSFDKNHPEHFFEPQSDGRLITTCAFLMDESYVNDEAGVIIADKVIYLGKGVELADCSIRTNAYICNGVKLLNARLFSTKNIYGESSYIGENTVLEDLEQVCKSVIGSNVYWHGHSLNNAIIGGGTKISSGGNMQSHRNVTDRTHIWDCQINKFVKIRANQASRTPLIVGVNNIFKGGTHLTAPSIVGKNHRVNSMLEIDGALIKGVYHHLPTHIKEKPIEYFA